MPAARQTEGDARTTVRRGDKQNEPRSAQQRTPQVTPRRRGRENLHTHAIGDGAIYGFMPLERDVGVRPRDAPGRLGEQLAGTFNRGILDSLIFQRGDTIAKHHEVTVPSSRSASSTRSA
jgi:hypothetical protein